MAPLTAVQLSVKDPADTNAPLAGAELLAQPGTVGTGGGGGVTVPPFLLQELITTIVKQNNINKQDLKLISRPFKVQNSDFIPKSAINLLFLRRFAT